MSAPPASDAKAFSTQKLALADRIRHDGRLSLSIRLIGAEICSLTNFRTGYAWAPEKYLAEKLGLGHRTVKMAVAALKAAGYIRVDKVGRSNRYVPMFDAGKGQNLPLSETEQGQNLPLSDEEGGKNRPEQGQKTTDDRGKKGPPISLEISLGISARAETAAAGGAAPVGAAGQGNDHRGEQPRYDLGLPGVALRQRLGDEVFKSWLGNVAVLSIGEELVLEAPSRFLASHVRSNFEEAILACWRVQHPEVRTMRVAVRAAVTPISTRRESPDARWLVDAGIDLVAERLHATRTGAEKTIVGWLQRCGRDVAGLRRIIEQAALLELDEVQFASVVKQRTRALLYADQPALKFGPEAVVRKRNAS